MGRITLAPGDRLAILDTPSAITRARVGAMNEQTDCAWCEREIQGPEDWIRSDGRRYHSACFHSWRQYRRLTQAAEPPKPRSSSQA